MAFELPRYRKCCCFSLRTGSLIIGYISIIIAGLTLGSISWSIYRVVMYVDTHKDKPDNNAVSRSAVDLYISFAYSLLVFLYYLVFSFLLVVGVHRNKPTYLRLYYRATKILVGMGIAMVILTSIFIGIIASVAVLKWVFTLLCCLVIVRSTYIEMEELQKRPVEQMTELELQPHVQQTPLMA